MIDEIRTIVEQKLKDSAHDMDHVNRVYRLAMNLAQGEDVDTEVILLAVLLHDIARSDEDNDNSGKTDHALIGADRAESILQTFNYPTDKINHVKQCIITHRFRSQHKPQTKEAQIVFDADKLDVLGSVGVARAFMFGGKYGERLHSEVDIKEYVQDNLVDGSSSGRIMDLSKHSPNLEYELKLKNIPEKLYTDKAKKIANERIKVMDEFFLHLNNEIKGVN